MKKLLFSVLALLVACGLAWADGVKVFGTVTFKAGTYTYFNPGYNDSIWLTSEDGVNKLKTKPISSYDQTLYKTVWRYEFASVEAGTYTISYQTSGYAGDNVTLSYSSSLTVAAEDIQHDIEVTDDPTHVQLKITPKYWHPNYNYWAEGLDSVKITCQKGAEEPEIQWTATSTALPSSSRKSSATFLCDTVSLYTVTLSCKGYKDTSFQTKAFGNINSYGISVGKTIDVPMQEVFDNQVILNGAVTMQGATEQDTISGLYLAVLWEKKTWVTEIKYGRQYEFKDPIPSGDIVYQLTTSPSVPYSGILAPAKNWQFASNNSDTLHYVLTTDKDTVTNNLSIVRVGVDITGLLIDTLSRAGSSNGIGYAKVKISDNNGTYQDSTQTSYSGSFSFSGVKNGTYTLTFSKSGYSTVTKEITINLAEIAIDSTVQVGEIASDPAEDDYVFYGRLSYTDPSSYATVYVDSAKVVIINQAGDRIDSTYTDTDGNWELTVRCYSQTTFTFEATSPKINKSTTTGTAYSERNNVYISCTAKTPELYGMQNAKARQIGALRQVELTWEWPDELIAGLADDTYRIFRINIYRAEVGSQYPTSLGFLMPENNSLPTRFVDSAAQYMLIYDKTYTYHFDVSYLKPNGTKTVTDNENLTVTIHDVVIPDSFNLYLQVNDPKMGTVTGGGKYEDGQEVSIKAIANPGYVFEAWKAGETEIATTADYKLVLTSDSTLTAVFAVKPVVVPDSVTLTLLVNDETMGTVEGEGKYEKGETVTIKATANTGYSFVAWINGTDTVVKTAEHTFTITENTTLTALFAVETAIEEREQAAWNVYAEDGQIVLRSNTVCRYDVYTVTGTLVKQAKPQTSEYRIAVNNSGLYIVRRTSSTGTSVKKIVVR